MVKFSVIMPMYNVEKFVSKSIRSVLNQSYNDFEFIIIDDGSRDNSFNIAKEYSKLDSRIKVYRQPNSGLVKTRRRAIRLSKGEYIVVIDSDDILNHNLLYHLSEKIRKEKPDIILYNYQKISDSGENIKINTHPLSLYGDDKETILNFFLSSNLLNSLWTKCVSRKLYLQDKIKYDNIGHLNMGDDRLLSLYPLLNAGKISFIDLPLYYYRENPNSLTNKFTIKSIQDLIKVYDLIFEFYILDLNEQERKKMLNFHSIDIIKKYLMIVKKQENKYILREIYNEIRNKYWFLESKKNLVSFKEKTLYRLFNNCLFLAKFIYKIYI